MIHVMLRMGIKTAILVTKDLYTVLLQQPFRVFRATCPVWERPTGWDETTLGQNAMRSGEVTGRHRKTSDRLAALTMTIDHLGDVTIGGEPTSADQARGAQDGLALSVTRQQSPSLRI